MNQTPLRFGIVTPIVTSAPRRSGPWEASAGAEELRKIAVVADTQGFHHVTCSEHVGIPEEIARVRGARYYDPLATFGYMAAVTTRLKFMTHVLVLPYHHPLAVAKRYGTLDRLSGGRLILGIGVGTLKEEFELLDAEFEKRGEIYTEALQALRGALGERMPSFDGKFYKYSGIVIDPHSIQRPVPMWLGGRSRISLRRAVTLADGWDPNRLEAQQIRDMLAEARSWPEWAKREGKFDLVLGPEPYHDISTDAGLAALVDQIAEFQALGATVLNLCFAAQTLEHFLEQMAIFTDRIAPRFR